MRGAKIFQKVQSLLGQRTSKTLYLVHTGSQSYCVQMKKSKTTTAICFISLGILIIFHPGCTLLDKGTSTPPFALAKATRQNLRLSVNTNGIIEPIDQTDIYAPIDGFVEDLSLQEGAAVTKGQLLMRLDSKQIITSLAEARVALLQARRQAQQVMMGPTNEELTAAETSIAEMELQLKQQREELLREEDLLKKNATTQAAVENRKKDINLLELRLDTLRQKKQALENRYSAEEKQWEQNRVSELSRQVSLLEQQVKMGSIIVPQSGILFTLRVKPGSYVPLGQLLAQIYQPGKVRLRAYVDEADLGRIEKGQQVLIEWDGISDQQWTGLVAQPATHTVAMGNRSVGEVICAFDNDPEELIPNINVNVQIVTSSKDDALLVPRTAVINQNGKPIVLMWNGKNAISKPVLLGAVTPQEIEILQGIEDGSTVVVNPSEASDQ